MLAQYFTNLSGLQREFTGGYEEECLYFRFVSVDLLERGYDESCCFSCAVLCAGEDVAFCESDGDGFFLDGRGTFEAGFEYAHEEFSFKVHVFEFESFGCEDVVCLGTVIFCWDVECGFPGGVVVSECRFFRGEGKVGR